MIDRNWSETIVGLINSAMYVSVAIFAIPTGVMARKQGCRKVYILAAILGSCIYLMLWLTNGPWYLYVLSFFLNGICTSMGGQVTAPIMIDNWFDKRKSFPLAITMTAGGIGGFILPSVAETLYKNNGVRGCWAFMGVFVALSLIPICVLMKDHPEDIGEVKDGKEWVRQHADPKSFHTTLEENGTVKSAESEEMSLREAYRSRPFILICLMNTIFRISLVTFIAYALLHMIRQDIPSASAVLVISASNLLSLIGRLSASITEKIKLPLKTWMAASFLMLAAGEVFFACFHSWGFFFLAGCLIGFATGFQTTLVPLLLSEYCGSAYFNEQFGMLNTVSFTCMIFSPMVVSASATAFGGYQVAYGVLAAVGILSAILAGGLKKVGENRKTEQNDDTIVHVG